MKRVLRSACLLLLGAVALQASAQLVLRPITEMQELVRDMEQQKGTKVKQLSDQITLNDVTYGIDKENNMAVVLGASQTLDNVVMEDEVTYDGTTYVVKEIGNSAFMNHPLTTVRLPQQLVRIGKSAFSDCPNLTSVSLPNTVELADTFAFLHCANLANVDLGQGVKSIGYGIFYQDSALVSISIPQSCIDLGAYAFQYCANLKSVTINGDYLSNIGYSCFANTGLESLILPKTVDKIENCMCWQVKTLTHVELPEHVTDNTVPGQAFVQCTALEEITLPPSYTAIGTSAFYDCNKLKTINLENITYYDVNALYYCALPFDLVLNDETTYVGKFAFANTGITSLKTGSKTQVIDYAAFYECTQLKNIVLKEGLQAIGASCFVRDALVEKLTIPSTVNIVDNMAFWGMGELKTLCCKATNPPTQVQENEYIDDYTRATLYVPDESIKAYQAAPYWQKFTNIKPLSEAPNFETVTVDNVVYELDLTHGTAVLIDGKAATGDFVVPNTITYDRDVVCTVIGIGNGAFDENTNLTSITLNEDLETIGDDAFQYSSIPALHLGPKVQSVGHDFHYKATSLAEITVDENNPYLCAENSLLMSKDKKIVWGFPVANPATELILPEEVEIVKDDACNRCKNLLTIVINDNCKTIENAAFDNCTSCTSLTMGKGIEYVGEQSFRSFRGLTELTLPENLTEIGFHAFGWCQNVKTIKFNEKLQRIRNYAFNHNDALEVVDLPASVNYINSYAFDACPSITEFRCRATVPPTLITDLWEALQELYTTVPLLVPAGSEEAYANAWVWEKFSVIEALPGTTGIDAIAPTGDATVVGIYTLDGKRLSEMQTGVNIIRMSDGTVRKVIK